MTNKPTFIQCLKAGLLAGIAAALINALLFLLFKQLGLITDSILIPPANEPLTLVPISMASLIPPVLGSGVYYLLARFTVHGFRYFTILALVVLVLSFANPFMGIPDVTISYGLALDALHVVVVGSLLYSLRKYAVSSLQGV